MSYFTGSICQQAVTKRMFVQKNCSHGRKREGESVKRNGGKQKDQPEIPAGLIIRKRLRQRLLLLKTKLLRIPALPLSEHRLGIEHHDHRKDGEQTEQ